MAAATRPLTLGEILDRTVQLYRRNFLLLLAIAAPAAALIVLISGVVVIFFSSQISSLAQASQSGTPAAAPDPQAALLIGLVAILFFLIGLPLILGVFSMALAALNYAAAQISRGQTTTMRASYGYAFRHFWRHVGVLFLQFLFAALVPYFVLAAIVIVGAIVAALATKSGAGTLVGQLLAIGMVLLVIAMGVICVLIWLRLSLAYPVCIAEEQKAWPSLKRSNVLTKGTRGRVFVMFLLVMVLSIAATLLLAIPMDIVIGLFTRKSIVGQAPPAQFLIPMEVASLAAGFLVRAFVMPIYSTALMLFYFDQRTRLEGYDIEQLMAQAGWSDLEPAPQNFAGPAPGQGELATTAIDPASPAPANPAPANPNPEGASA